MFIGIKRTGSLWHYCHPLTQKFLEDNIGTNGVIQPAISFSLQDTSHRQKCCVLQHAQPCEHLYFFNPKIVLNCISFHCCSILNFTYNILEMMNTFSLNRGWYWLAFALAMLTAAGKRISRRWYWSNCKLSYKTWLKLYWSHTSVFDQWHTRFLGNLTYGRELLFHFAGIVLVFLRILVL